MKKRLCSLMLAIVMVVGWLPDITPAQAATHSHTLCGNSYCDCASYSHASQNWTAWDGTTTMTSGYYYLTEDIELSSTKILNYSYTTYLCLNGHTITCADTVFDIYSLRTLHVTDCVGGGTIETTSSDCTIGNNKVLSLWGGTILNSGGGHAISAYASTSTYIRGGRVESTDYDAIEAYPGSNIRIEDGEVHTGAAYCYAVTGFGSASGQANLTVTGGRVTGAGTGNSVLDLQDGSFTMTGGYVGGDVYVYDETGTTTISGGTIEGTLLTYSESLSVTGGSMVLTSYAKTSTISAGTFHEEEYYGSTTLGGENITVNGGDFTDCEKIYLNGPTWISGGSFSTIQITEDPLYLSGVPAIDALEIFYPGTVYGQNPDSTGSFGGDPIEIVLRTEETTWKDGDVVVRNVTSDAVAERFVLTGDDTRWRRLVRSGNDLVLEIVPHGTWGDNVSWGVENGVLTISGEGAIADEFAGHDYLWYDYHDQFTEVVVEEGITQIPSYTFEFLEDVTSITLPDTLTYIELNAFNDCGSLNNLLLPASLTSIGSGGYTSNFIRCESLTDVYYLGTEEEWDALPYSDEVISFNSKMTLHFLQLQDGSATCTEEGKVPHYQFDDTSVYDSLYDLNKQVITEIETTPALGHRVVMQAGETIDPLVFENDADNPFNLDGAYYNSTNYKNHSASELRIKAVYPCTLKLTYGVSSEQSFDYLRIYHNGIELDAISGEVSGKEMTVPMGAGDVLSIGYSKDMSNSSGQDCGWFTPEYDKVTLTTEWDMPAELFSPTCTEPVVCDYCGEEVYGAWGHDWCSVEYTWAEGGSACAATRICGNDQAHTETAHAVITSAVTKAPTATEMGETTYTAAFTVGWAETQTMTLADIPMVTAPDGISTSAANLDLANGSIVITQADGITTFTQGDTELRTTAGAGIIRQSNNGAATENTITVESGTVNLTVSGINIESTSGAPIDVKPGAALTLNLVGENTVAAPGYHAGVQIPNGAELTVKGTGALSAAGGYSGAGIGSNWCNDGSGRIVIESGEITAVGGEDGAGIGSGYYNCSGGTTIINGGIVTATGGKFGAGIGGSRFGSGGDITINGGTVTAEGGMFAAGIGGGSSGYGGNVLIANAEVMAKGYYHAIGGGRADDAYGCDSVVIEDSATVHLSRVLSESTDIQEKITVHKAPADASAKAGEMVTFAVDAFGASGLAYQWQVSSDNSTWTDLAGETGEMVAISVSADNDSHYYRCVLINGWGNMVYTDPAQVHMLADVRGIEYTIHSMGMYDIDTHDAYKAIPQDQFLLEVEVQNECSNEIDTILLVQFSPEGQMLGMQYLYGRTHIGETYIFGASIDNRDGSIGCIKAFVVPTVGSMIPLAESMTIEGIGETEKPEQPVLRSLSPVFYPGDETDNIPVNADLTLTFDEKVYNDEGMALTSTYLKDVIELRKGSESGDTVDFSVAINSAKKVITINPTSNLSKNTTYYLIVEEGVLTNIDDETNDELVYSFKTANSTGLVPLAMPASGSTVETDTDFVFVFDGGVYQDNGDYLTSSYIESYVFEIREGSKTGTKINFEAEIDSDNEIITLITEELLEDDETYYVIMDGDELTDVDGNDLPDLTFVYYTGSVAVNPPTETNELSVNVEADDDSAKLTIDYDYSEYANVTKAYMTVYYRAEGGTWKTSSCKDALLSTNLYGTKTVTISDLDADQIYEFEIEIDLYDGATYVDTDSYSDTFETETAVDINISSITVSGVNSDYLYYDDFEYDDGVFVGELWDSIEPSNTSSYDYGRLKVKVNTDDSNATVYVESDGDYTYGSDNEALYIEISENEYDEDFVTLYITVEDSDGYEVEYELYVWLEY